MMMIMRAMCLGFLLVWVGAHSQETQAELELSLRKVQAELEKEKELHTKEKSSFEAFKKNSLQKKEDLKKQIQSVLVQNESLAKRRSALVGELTSAKSELGAWRHKEADFKNQVNMMIDTMMNALNDHMPVRFKAKREQLQLLKEELKSSSPAENVLQKLWNYAVEWVQEGAQMENWDGYFATQAGQLGEVSVAEGSTIQRVPGKFVRFGGIYFGFISLDLSHYYLLHHDRAKYIWREIPKGSDVAQKMQSAMQIASGKEPPTLVLLPTPSAQVEVLP